jgi:hypothetical protein
MREVHVTVSVEGPATLRRATNREHVVNYRELDVSCS